MILIWLVRFLENPEWDGFSIKTPNTLAPTSTGKYVVPKQFGSRSISTTGLLPLPLPGQGVQWTLLYALSVRTRRSLMGRASKFLSGLCILREQTGRPNTPWRYIHYTALSNLCDYTTSVFPVTACDPAIDVKLPAHEFRSSADKMIYELCKRS